MLARNNTPSFFEGQQRGGTLGPATEQLDDILVAGVTAIIDINNLINELQAASDCSQAGAGAAGQTLTMRTWLKRHRPRRRASPREYRRWRNPERLSSPPSPNPANDASHIVQNEG
jgi:hypothetical protein